MEKYGMAAPDDDNTIDCYQQYVAQTGYRCELPDYSRTNYSGRPEWYSEEPRNCDPYERTDYRAPLTNRGGNLRNGLYSHSNAPSGAGDCYNSLPGKSNPMWKIYNIFYHTVATQVWETMSALFGNMRGVIDGFSNKIFESPLGYDHFWRSMQAVLCLMMFIFFG